MMLRRLRLFSSFAFLGLSTLVLSGCGEEAVSYSIELEVWGVFDDSDAYQEIFKQYRDINPFVKNITYRKLSPETYKEDLIDAMASGKGPDIFMIRNTWVDAFQDKTVPAPPTLITEKMFRDALIDVAAEDSILADGQIYSIPLSVDSLALYYNKDLLNAAGITAPPATWEDVANATPRLTRIDVYGNVTQSAIALGTAYNINRSTDALVAMAYQLNPDFNPANMSETGLREAFEFYTQFARSGSSLYTWNPRLHYSIDAFYEGTLAMMVNYSWHYQTIRQKNAKFNFSVAPLPQFTDGKPANFANYWAYAVAKNKMQPTDPNAASSKMPAAAYQDARTREAWQLLKFLALPHPNKQFTVYNVLSGTSRAMSVTTDPAKDYLDKTKKPAARRDLIEAQKNDVQLAPFGLGNLIARSWKPRNTEAVETIVAEAIDTVNRGERTVGEAIQVLSNRSAQFRSTDSGL